MVIINKSRESHQAIISLSGGMDSGTLLALVSQKYDSVLCVLFKYNSKHNKLERTAAKKLIKYVAKEMHASIEYLEVDITKCFEHTKSHLLNNDPNIEIPKGKKYNPENGALTEVPGRNLIFSSILASIAQSRGIKDIFLGIQNDDYQPYPDCRPEFIASLDTTIRLSSDKKVRILTPFLHYKKFEILQAGLKVINKKMYKYTRTCYTLDKVACGKCSTCLQRRNAFEKCGKVDLIDYQE